MFTEADREALLAELIEHAHTDPAVTAAAVVGSNARRATDQWSDIDLAVRLANEAEPATTADAWLTYLDLAHGVVDHLDLWSGPALYRVCLLVNSLQVDVSFWPAGAFASNGEPFDLLFGEAGPATVPGGVEPRDVIGWAWLYALHTRSAIARGRPWQASLMIDGLRDRVITLACLRHGLPAHQGRGADQLPKPTLSRLSSTLIARPEPKQLIAAFDQLVDLLAEAIEAVDSTLAARLRPVLTVLIKTATLASRPSPSITSPPRPEPSRVSGPPPLTSGAPARLSLNSHSSGGAHHQALDRVLLHDGDQLVDHPGVQMSAQLAGRLAWNSRVTIMSCSSACPAPGASTPRTSTGRESWERLAVPRWMVRADRADTSPILGSLN